MHRFPTKVLLVLLPLACAGPAPAEEDLTARIDQALPKLEAIVRDGMARTGVPGLSVAVVYGDQIVRSRASACGRWASTSPSMPTRSSSWRRCRSRSPRRWWRRSSATAWSHGTIRSSGTSRPSTMHDAWVTREVTLRDMFCHRSGLPDHAGDLLEDIGYDRDRGAASPALRPSGQRASARTMPIPISA